MALNLTPFQQQVLQMRGAPVIDKPGWGPPDMSEQIQKGIASLYGLYRGAEGAAEAKRHTQDIAKNPGQRAAALGQPGGIYGPTAPVAPTIGYPTVAQGGVGPDDPRATTSTPASRAAGGQPFVPPTPQEVRAYYRDAAVKRGIDPDVMERVVLSEGGWDNVVRQSEVRNAQGIREQSYGPLQLYMGGGLGNEALARGIDPRDPTQWKQAGNFALEKAAMLGWTPWHGAKAAGVGPRQGLNMSGDTGLEVATAGQPTTFRSGDPRTATVQPPAYGPSGPQPKEQFRTHIQEAYPLAKITSDYRDPERNREVGGAKNSQHTHGTALDLDVSGMSTEQKQSLVREARAQGARGIGWYNPNSLHIDWREGAPAAWGPNRSKTSLGQTEPWFQEEANQLFATGGTASPPAPAVTDPNGNVAQAQPQGDPRVVPQAAPQVAPQVAPQAAQGGPGGQQAGPQAPPNPAPVTQSASPLFPPAPQFSDPLAGHVGPAPDQQPYQVAGPAVAAPRQQAAAGGGILPPGHGYSFDDATGQRVIVNDQGVVVGPADPPLPPRRPGATEPPVTPPQQPRVAPQQPQVAPQQPQVAPQTAAAGGGLPPEAASAVAGVGIDPAAIQDLDPRWIMALGAAMGSGDPNLVNSVANSINSVVGARGTKGAGDWDITPDGQGGFIRHNKRTGVYEQVGGGTGAAPAARIIPPDAKAEREKFNIDPNDRRSYQVKYDAKGRITSVDPLTEEKRDPNPEFQQEQQLAKDVTSSKVFQKYDEGKQTLAQVKAQFSQADTTGDMAAMYTFMRSLDPGSTVGPADLANMKEAGGYAAQLASIIEKASGTGGITPELRRQFYNTAVATLRSTAPAAKQLVETQRNKAKGYKLNPDRVAIFEPIPEDIATPVKRGEDGSEPFAGGENRGAGGDKKPKKATVPIPPGEEGSSEDNPKPMKLRDGKPDVLWLSTLPRDAWVRWPNGDVTRAGAED